MAAAIMLTCCIGCTKDETQPEPEPQPEPVEIHEKLILLNEGNWQSDNGQLSYIHDGEITNKWFQSVNGIKLGDTPQDIVQINDTLLAISVNWSNIIQYIRPDGTLVAQTENVPNCRSLCVDDDSAYLYVTSYAHLTALGEEYEKGYVAKIDIRSFNVVSTCEVGYEPEGIAFYKGKLFIANTGGYAFSEGHDYENTVSVMDASSMTLLRNISVEDSEGNRMVNLYGKMSQVGPYLCINSAGDYISAAPATVIFNCENETYKVYPFPSTYNTSIKGGMFFIVGTSFSYLTYESEYYVCTINPYDESVTDGYILPDGSVCKDIVTDIMGLTAPYCVYQNPYSGHLYVTDALSYSSAGAVYEYDSKGIKISTMKSYINPGHMIAIP